MSKELSTDTLDINNFQELMSFADRIAKSSMVPKDYVGRPENIIVAVMMGKELGLKPFQAMQNIAVINGRPSIWGDAALALVIAHPDFEDIKEDDFETIKKNKKAICTVKRKGRAAVTRSFDEEDAKIAGLLTKQGTWTQYRQRMLQMRARAFALRDSFTDVLKGVSIGEEAQDMPVEKDITPDAKTKISNLIAEKKTEIPVENSTEKVEEKKEVKDSDLSIVLQMIEDADCVEALEATQTYARMLIDEDKKDARAAYKEKKEFFERNKANVCSEASNEHENG